MTLIFVGCLEGYRSEQTGKPAKFSALYEQYAKQDRDISCEELLRGGLRP